MLRFGQSTRWFILSGGPQVVEIEDENGGGGEPRKKIQIVSRRQNEEMLMKRRIDQIRKLDEQMKSHRERNMKRLHGDSQAEDEEGGISWGMGLEDDE